MLYLSSSYKNIIFTEVSVAIDDELENGWKYSEGAQDLSDSVNKVSLTFINYCLFI